jgi:hypothetical protein
VPRRWGREGWLGFGGGEGWSFERLGHEPEAQAAAAAVPVFKPWKPAEPAKLQPFKPAQPAKIVMQKPKV